MLELPSDEGFGKLVHAAYQRMGSKLRNTVSATNMPTTDWYCAFLSDDLDNLESLANQCAAAMGRKTDELIIEALDGSTNYAGPDTDGLTKAKVLTAFEMMGGADIPDDGERFAVVGWPQWAELLYITEFANSEDVGGEVTAKRWLGTTWIPHSGVSCMGAVRRCHWYHKSAVGHLAGGQVYPSFNWEAQQRAYLVSSMMAQSAVLIEPAGVVTMRCLEGEQ